METDQAPRWKPPTERNLKTAARFKHESWWQITFPVLVVTLLMFGCLAGLLLFSGESGVSIVADYSLILLILPLLVVGLVIIAMVIGLIYLVSQGIGKLPPYTYVAHKAVFSVRNRVESIAGMITGAIISVRAFVDGIIHFVEERLPKSGDANPAPPPPASAEAATPPKRKRSTATDGK